MFCIVELLAPQYFRLGESTTELTVAANCRGWDGDITILGWHILLVCPVGVFEIFLFRLARQPDNEARAIPNFDIVNVKQPFCLFGCLVIVLTNNRFEPDEMPIGTDGKSPVLCHPESPY
jgi:hypothetical protein